MSVSHWLSILIVHSYIYLIGNSSWTGFSLSPFCRVFRHWAHFFKCQYLKDLFPRAFQIFLWGILKGAYLRGRCNPMWGRIHFSCLSVFSTWTCLMFGTSESVCFPLVLPANTLIFYLSTLLSHLLLSHLAFVSAFFWCCLSDVFLLLFLSF